MPKEKTDASYILRLLHITTVTKILHGILFNIPLIVSKQHEGVGEKSLPQWGIVEFCSGDFFTEWW